jgi:large repetitive protein
MNLITRARGAVLAAVAATVALGVGPAGGADAGAGVAPAAAPTVAPVAPDRSPASSAGHLTVAVTRPTRPRSPTAKPGNTRARLTWLAPSSTGGTTINKYAVQRSKTGTGQWKTVGYPKRTSFTATDLQNGVRYSFRIRAHNAAGWGPYSTVVKAVPRTVPTAPRSPVATPTNATVKLTWQRPSSNGGSTIDKYRVQRAPSSSGPWTDIAAAATLSYTNTGLTNGTRYYFRTRAHNAAGWGSYSVVVSAVPRTVPTAPMYPHTVASDGKVLVTWSAPSSDGGAMVNKYAVQRTTSPAGPWAPIASPTSRDYWATGLSNGTTYYFRVLAHNAAGWSTPSYVVADVPLTVPTAPQSLTWSPSYTTVKVTWLAPASDGGAVIDTYEVERSLDQLNWQNVGNTLATSTNVDALKGGTTYYFRVRAHNAAGWGAWTTTPAVHTLLSTPSAPTACSAVQYFGPGNGAVYIDWDAPASDGGSPIINYNVSIKNFYLEHDLDTAGNIPTDQWDSLPPGVYDIYVRARNSEGLGAACSTWVWVQN